MRGWDVCWGCGRTFAFDFLRASHELKCIVVRDIAASMSRHPSAQRPQTARRDYSPRRA